MVEYAFQVLDALDFCYGPSHGEYMLTETGPVLIEVGARPMGGHFPRPLLHRLLGHHLTDVSLDSYLDPEAFERERKKPYRTRGFLMNKFFITPRGGDVNSYPILTILRSLKTFAGSSLLSAFTALHLPTTVDLDSAPGNILLYSEDENAVWQDYRILRTIEKQCFSALFEIASPPEEYPSVPPRVPSLKGLKGKVRILADEKLKIQDSREGTGLPAAAEVPAPADTPAAAGMPAEEGRPGARWTECLTTDEMDAAKKPADAGIFLMRNGYSLEERVSLLYALVRSIRPGGTILIPEEIYRPISIGRTGLELLLEAFGVTLEVPVYGTDRSIFGTVEEREKNDA